MCVIWISGQERTTVQLLGVQLADTVRAGHHSAFKLRAHSSRGAPSLSLSMMGRSRTWPLLPRVGLHYQMVTACSALPIRVGRVVRHYLRPSFLILLLSFLPLVSVVGKDCVWVTQMVKYLSALRETPV